MPTLKGDVSSFLFQNFCAVRNSHLAYMEDSSENAFLTDYLQNHNGGRPMFDIIKVHIDSHAIGNLFRLKAPAVITLDF